MAVSSLILGGLLNLSGLERPAAYGTVNAVIVPLATILLLASIGLALRFSRVGNYLRECVSVSVIKFFLVPVCASSLAWAIGFGDIDSALPLKVVVILSSMPVAFNALIPPSIYDLDLDLANSCWFVTTALLGPGAAIPAVGHQPDVNTATFHTIIRNTESYSCKKYRISIRWSCCGLLDAACNQHPVTRNKQPALIH